MALSSASLPAAPPIGVFDSGVGGLSILAALRRALPHVDLIYVADQAHVPYGPRSLEQVRQFSHAITRFLLAQRAGLIVVACNTASAAALLDLRRAYPHLPFVGMEPAVKPAAEHTHTGVVGVLATPATFQGALYASVVERFARDVRVLQDTCAGLVECIEAGDLDGAAPRRILTNALQPMLAAGIDAVVLGCTHYPFVTPLIAELAGPGVRVIDPAPAVARQAARLYPGASSGAAPGAVRLLTTGAPAAFQRLLPRLWSEPGIVAPLRWTPSGELVDVDRDQLRV